MSKEIVLKRRYETSEMRKIPSKWSLDILPNVYSYKSVTKPGFQMHYLWQLWNVIGEAGSLTRQDLVDSEDDEPTCRC